MESKEIVALWREYKKNPTDTLLGELVENYKTMADTEASKMYAKLGRQVELDDLRGEAYIGLLDAIRKYDVETEWVFSTYARMRIKGAILDGVRGMDWLSRNMRKKQQMYKRTVQELEQMTGEKAKEKDIKEALGWQDSLLWAVITADENPHMQYIDSTDEVLENEIGASMYGNPEQETEEKLDRETIHKAIAELGSTDREYIKMYYIEGRTYKQIGAVMGRSEAGVCQRLKAIKGRLGKKLQKEMRE